AVGLGYFAGLIQLHFQHAASGAILPTAPEVIKQFHGTAGPPMSQIERLIRADEKLKFDSTGSMAAAFTTKSAATKQSDKWDRAISEKIKESKLDRDSAEFALRREREGEKKAFLAWLAAGLPEEAYTADKFPLPAERKEEPITAEFVDGADVKIK